MAGSLNKVMIIGNLGQDPEVRSFQNGGKVCNLRIATTESWKDKDGSKQERTEWHRVVFFGKIAEIAGQYLRKGSKVYIEGRLQTRKYTDKDGIERYATDIIAENMQMLGGRQGMGGGDSMGGGMGGGMDDDYSAPQRPAPRQAPPAPAARPQPKPAPNFSDMDDDIPF